MFSALMRDLIARGRAAGIIVVAATQKPSNDVIPTSIRDLMALRFALRCTVPEASDTILGRGWASAGCDASTIPVGKTHRGVGYLLAEGEQPSKLKAFYLDDDTIDAIVSRRVTEHLDSEAEELLSDPMPVVPDRLPSPVEWPDVAAQSVDPAAVGELTAARCCECGCGRELDGMDPRKRFYDAACRKRHQRSAGE
jgi:hypothetical protein